MMQNTDTAQTKTTLMQPDLRNEVMPVTNRTNMFTKMAGVAAMSMALASEPAVAQSPTNAPASPTPATAPGASGYRVLSPEEVQQYISTQVAPANAAPAQGGGVVKDTTKVPVTVLEKRLFCMDNEGNILALGSRRLQVGPPGKTIEGTPSKGECLRAIAEGIAELKQMNGGVIPDGYNVKVVLLRTSGESKSYINPNVVPDLLHLSPLTLRSAMADPVTEAAIMSIHDATRLAVKNEGDSMTMTFKDKHGNRPVALTVELEKR